MLCFDHQLVSSSTAPCQSQLERWARVSSPSLAAFLAPEHQQTRSDRDARIGGLKDAGIGVIYSRCKLENSPVPISLCRRADGSRCYGTQNLVRRCSRSPESNKCSSCLDLSLVVLLSLSDGGAVTRNTRLDQPWFHRISSTTR